MDKDRDLDELLTYVDEVVEQYTEYTKVMPPSILSELDQSKAEFKDWIRVIGYSPEDERVKKLWKMMVGMVGVMMFNFGALAEATGTQMSSEEFVQSTIGSLGYYINNN